MALQGWMPCQCDKASPKGSDQQHQEAAPSRAGHVAGSSMQEGEAKACIQGQGDDDEQGVRAIINPGRRNRWWRPPIR